MSFKIPVFSNMAGYKKQWTRSDFMAALVVTAIAIPESLGYAVIVGLPVQAGLYCALLAPIIFAALTSSKHLVIGADSATAALVAAGGAAVAVAGTAEYGNAIAVLGLVTGVVLLAMSLLKFGFMADLISRPVLAGFISGVGVQLIVGKLPEMLGLHAHGTLLNKASFLLSHLANIGWPTAALSAAVVAIVIAGWRFRYPGALLALLLAIVATKIFELTRFDIEVIGNVPAGLPGITIPHISPEIILTVLPTAFSIAVVILAQSLAVIRNSATKHEEVVNDNQDLMALGFAQAASAMVGGFAVNGSPPRTSAGEMAGGRSQLVNVFMAVVIGFVLLFATGLFKYVPDAALAAIVFTIGIHLLKIDEIKQIMSVRRSEFIIAMIALVTVAFFGVQKGVLLAVILSLIERLRRQYHPSGDLLLRDKKYGEWAVDRFVNSPHPVEAPAGVVAYRFNEALFFENAGFFQERVVEAMKDAKSPVTGFILDASAITDIDYTAAQVLGRLIEQMKDDEVKFSLAHASPHLKKLLRKYSLFDLIGGDNIYPSLRFALEAYTRKQIDNVARIKKLELTASQYVVIGGAAMEILGLRKTTAVDLVVSKRVYDDFKAKGWKEYVQDSGKRILVHHGYRLMLTWMDRDLRELRSHVQIVNTIPIIGLDDMIACKTELGRKKDLEDVKLIRAYRKKAE